MICKNPNESNDAFIKRVLEYKISNQEDISWHDVSDIIEQETGIYRDESTWRKKAKKLNKNYPEAKNSESDNPIDQMQQLINEFKIERYKLNDINTQNNAYLRRIAREETIKEIAENAAKEIGRTLQLPYSKVTRNANKEQEAILQISDWHFGIEVDNYWNKFNPDICKQRVANLKSEVIETLDKFEIKKLHIVNLSDLIAGRIHASIRYESRCDVITQTINVAEILAEFMIDICNFGIDIEYYDCLDNHSRLEPIKADSLDLESLARVIPWYLKTRLEKYSKININANTYDEDIIDFYVLGYRVGGVHGHKDKPNKVVEGLTLMTKEHFDLILTAHYHHFSCDEKNETLVISNGSLMGTDNYAKNLRLCSQPSQNLIIVNRNNVAEYIKRIPLN